MFQKTSGPKAANNLERYHFAKIANSSVEASCLRPAIGTRSLAYTRGCRFKPLFDVHLPLSTHFWMVAQPIPNQYLLPSEESALEAALSLANIGKALESTSVQTGLHEHVMVRRDRCNQSPKTIQNLYFSVQYDQCDHNQHAHFVVSNVYISRS